MHQADFAKWNNLSPPKINLRHTPDILWIIARMAKNYWVPIQNMKHFACDSLKTLKHCLAGLSLTWWLTWLWFIYDNTCWNKWMPSFGVPSWTCLLTIYCRVVTQNCPGLQILLPLWFYLSLVCFLYLAMSIWETSWCIFMNFLNIYSTNYIIEQKLYIEQRAEHDSFKFFINL